MTFAIAGPPGDDSGIFLSTLPAGPRQRRLALAVVLISAVIFAVAAPFARKPLAPVWAFIPIYESALVINDVITAILLFGQFSILRSRALCLLASAYLFTALMTIAHALSFPGLFAPTGLLGAGVQSTAWLYMFWHGGFPLIVIAYALLRNHGHDTLSGRKAALAVVASVTSMIVLAGAFTLLATAGQGALPAIMQDNHYTPAMIFVIAAVWTLSLAAVVVLWRRSRSVLDLWLMVVMCAWLFDIGLAVIFNAGRFDLGFYAGRIYGYLAASFVLAVVLLENGMLYARLVAVHASERSLSRELDRHNRALEQIVAERTQRLLQSEKVATMGSLLAGVAHELNNPLAVVMAHAQLLRERTVDEGEKTRARKIAAAAERCARIVKNFLALARQRPPERGEVDVNALVRETLEMLAYELRTDSVEVTCDLEERLPRLWADGHQLQQVLINLVTNAHHAMRKYGSARRLRVTTQAAPGNRVRVAIADSGPGIPPEVREKIFEPFFTTKPAGEGTGLGLSLCRNIVDEHAGTLTVESRPGEGATFLIDLPVSAGARPAARDDTVERVATVGSRRLLVVDDEAEIADVLADILREVGHQVDIAHEGGAALEFLARQSYDLVLSDTKMPGLDGVGFYREVQRRFPAMAGRFVFVSGDVLSSEKREFLESAGVPYLTKPFDVPEVRRVAQQVLNAPRQGG